MALSDVVIATHTATVGKAEVTVRGLNASDVAYLFLNDRESVERFTELWKKANGEITQAFVNQVLAELPDLVAKVIACAADEATPKAITTAKKLPLPTQLELVNAVARMTFEGVGVKKFMEEAIILMQGLNTGLREVGLPQPSGTGG